MSDVFVSKMTWPTNRNAKVKMGKKYQGKLLHRDRKDPKYNIITIVTDDGKPWSFYQKDFYSEKELHEKEFNNQIDEFLK